MFSDTIVVQRSRWCLAALWVELKLLRLGLVLRAYNPGQPRVPAGHPDGGRWTSDDSSTRPQSDDGTRLFLVSDENDQRYRVDLRAEEGRGGHTLGRHIGKSDDELYQRIRKLQWRSLLSHGGMRRTGSFSSIESANNLVNQTIENNKTIVDLVASGIERDAFVTHTFTHKTGREAYSNDDSVIYLRDTHGVGALLIHDPTSPRGFRVRTAYPRTEGD